MMTGAIIDLTQGTGLTQGTTTIIATVLMLEDTILTDSELQPIALSLNNNVSHENIIIKGEHKMAEVDTVMLSQEHADIRREGAEHANEIVKEGIKTGFDIRGDVKDARFDVSERVGNQGDRIVDRVEESKDALMARTWDLGRESADNRAQILALSFQVRDGFAQSAAIMENSVLRNEIAGHKDTQYLSDKISADGDRTRDLIQDLKYHDLNRALLERNSELLEERHGHRHWRHAAEQNQFGAQWAQLQSQVQAFASQLQETRQGMVNFGTMSGQSGQQTSTSNNVR